MTFKLGTTEPTDANTGVGAGYGTAQTVDQLHNYTGTLRPRKDLDLHDIRVTGVIAPNSGVRVRLFNCEVVLTDTYDVDTWAVRAHLGRVEAYGCDVHGVPYDTNVAGFGLQNLHAERCRVYRVVDGFDLTGPATVWGCYVYALQYLTPDRKHSDDRTHSDCVQVLGGHDVDLWGNSLQSYASKYSTARTEKHPQALSCVMLTPNLGPVTGLRVRDNWMDGGEISVNGGALDRAKGNTGVISGNRFGRGQFYRGHTIDLDESASGVKTSGNVWADTGRPVRVRRNA